MGNELHRVKKLKNETVQNFYDFFKGPCNYSDFCSKTISPSATKALSVDDLKSALIVRKELMSLRRDLLIGNSQTISVNSVLIVRSKKLKKASFVRNERGELRASKAMWKQFRGKVTFSLSSFKINYPHAGKKYICSLI